MDSRRPLALFAAVLVVSLAFVPPFSSLAGASDSHGGPALAVGAEPPDEAAASGSPDGHATHFAFDILVFGGDPDSGGFALAVFSAEDPATRTVAASPRSLPSEETWSATAALSILLGPEYTGEWKDANTGLYYLFRRFYDPDLGRFLSQDPVLGSLGDPQSLDRYPYVANNPVTSTDPTGMTPDCSALPSDDEMDPWERSSAWRWSRETCGVAVEFDERCGAACDAGPMILGAILGLVPGLETVMDLIYTVDDCRRAWLDPTDENKKWCGVSASFLATPFVGGGLVRFARLANRIDSFGDIGRTLSHEGHAAELGLRDVAELSQEARAFARRALTQKSFHLFYGEGSDLIIIGMHEVRGHQTLLKGVYSLSENRVRTLFRLDPGNLAAHVYGKILDRGWVPAFV